MELTDTQKELRAAFRRFADERVLPYAASADRDGVLREDVLAALSGEGYLGAAISSQHGGRQFDELTYGLMCEELGRACSAARSLVTVQSMVARTIERWCSPGQRERWLPELARGRSIAAFCLTEPDVGSDAAKVATRLEPSGDEYIVTGCKRWVTFGLRADLYLALGSAPEGPTAILVERETPGLRLSPVAGQLGLRGAMLADIDLDGCRVPKENVVGKPGTGFSHVVATTLDHGRYSVAWGCVGIGQAALEASAAYAQKREQFGEPIANHQLVRRMIADMLADVRSARLVCANAGRLRDRRDPRGLHETLLAKYVAAKMAARVTSDAVQVHGANGCAPGHPVERGFRDAKVMQIIEGTDQMLQLQLSELAYREHGA